MVDPIINKPPTVEDYSPSVPQTPTQPKTEKSYFTSSHSIKPSQDKWVNSSTALKIRSFLFKTLSLVTKPFNSSVSEYYNFRMKRVDTKLSDIKSTKILQSIFGDRWIPGAKNMVQKQKIEKQAEIVKGKQQLSEKILTEVKKTIPNAKFSEEAQELQTEGICFGIMVDLADRYLDSDGDKLVMEKLITELEKGGSLEAETYQGGLQRVDASVFTDFAVDVFHTSIENIKNDPFTSTLSKILPHIDKSHQKGMIGIIFNLALIDTKDASFMEKIRNNESYLNMLFPLSREEESKMMSDFSKNKSDIQQFGLNFLMAKTFNILKNEDQSNWTEIHKEKKILNTSYVQGKMIEELDKVFNQKIGDASPEQKNFLIKRREQLIGEIKLAAASREYNDKSTVTDPTLNVIFESGSILIKQEALLSLKGLSLNPTTDVMGSHIQFRDDESYLNNLDKLEPGFYWLSIKLKEGGHAVSFIKEADGSGYLIDPNNRKLKFSNMDEAKELALKLVSTYSQPSTVIPGHPYHKLSLFRIEKNIENT